MPPIIGNESSYLTLWIMFCATLSFFYFVVALAREPWRRGIRFATLVSLSSLIIHSRVSMGRFVLDLLHPFGITELQQQVWIWEGPFSDVALSIGGMIWAWILVSIVTEGFVTETPEQTIARIQAEISRKEKNDE
jgi:hypothetical protein